MREIKFRGFDTRINTMYPYIKLVWNGSIEARLDQDNLHSVVDITMEHKNGTHNDYSEEYIKVMQYTGLKDKNGKEIYEGDIVKVTSIDGYERIKEMVCGEALYGGYQFKFKSLDGKEDGYCFDDSNPIGNWVKKWNTLEIIGNIYENSELLKSYSF